jgi:hypothetical protein
MRYLIFPEKDASDGLKSTVINELVVLWFINRHTGTFVVQWRINYNVYFQTSTTIFSLITFM